MNIDLPIEELEAFQRSLVLVKDHEDAAIVAALSLRISEALNAAERVEAEASYAGVFHGEKDSGVRPMWPALRRALASLEQPDAPAATTASRDLLQAELRDDFDGLGIPIREPIPLYVAMVTVSIFEQMVGHMYRRGATPLTTVQAAGLATRTFLRALADYVPQEARR